METHLVRIADRHQALRAEREPRIRDFVAGKRQYLIYQQQFEMTVFYAHTPEESFAANLKSVSQNLDVPSDHVPFMEPWFGTGVYANMYGAPYYWRKDEAPATHYKYHALEEIPKIAKPRWEDGEVARLVMDTIRHFKSKTGDALPIVLTDTQSANDTATLIVDASEIIAGQYAEPETVYNLMRQINELIIEFSRAQAEAIGDALLQPGHLFLSGAPFGGISVSDDNIAFTSPGVNREFTLRLDETLGAAFGGITIHSCGAWAHTMRILKESVPSCRGIDCALDLTMDPTPNEAEDVRDAMAGTGIPVQVRLTGETNAMLETVERLLHPELRLVLWPAFVDIEAAERNYDLLNTRLAAYYAA